MIIKYHHLSYLTIFRTRLMTVVHARAIVNSEAERPSGTWWLFCRIGWGHPAWHPFLDPVLALHCRAIDTFEFFAWAKVLEVYGFSSWICPYRRITTYSTGVFLAVSHLQSVRALFVVCTTWFIFHVATRSLPQTLVWSCTPLPKAHQGHPLTLPVKAKFFCLAPAGNHHPGLPSIRLPLLLSLPPHSHCHHATLNKCLRGAFLSFCLPPPSQSQNPHCLECPLDTGHMSRLMQPSPNLTVSLAASTGAVCKA